MTAVNPPPFIALDADVLIYSATPHPLGRRLLALFEDHERYRLCGSTLLLPEAGIKPLRQASAELNSLRQLFSRIELWPATEQVCDFAVVLGAKYGLKTIDAVHLATAADGGADVFLTNNRNDFEQDAIEEIDVLYPSDLPG